MVGFPEPNEITFKFSGDGPYRKDVDRAIKYATSKNPNLHFTLNIIYDYEWFDTQTIVVGNYNIGMQLHKFLTDMTKFLNSEGLNMEPYKILFEDN